MKKILLGILIVLVVAAGVFLYGGYRMFGDELTAIQSIKEVREGVYTLTYKGDYGFKGFLEQGGAKTDAQMAEYIAGFLSHGYVKTKLTTPEGGCTTVTGNGLFARNFDWEPAANYIIIRTEPADGYASIATSNLAFMGFGDDWHPETMTQKFMALATVYVPLDGMNEKGLCVADLVEIDGNTNVPDTPRPDLTIVGAIRLVLDYAADVDEAVKLLADYDVFPSVGRMHHLSLSDRNGKSVAVEWKDGVLTATPTSIVTNHCLAEERENDNTDESHRRFDMLAAGFLPLTNSQQAQQAIEAASYEDGTLWSVVYDQQALTATHYFGCKWEEGLMNTLNIEH